MTVLIWPHFMRASSDIRTRDDWSVVRASSTPYLIDREGERVALLLVTRSTVLSTVREWCTKL